jgi:hypothetical protein
VFGFALVTNCPRTCGSVSQALSFDKTAARVIYGTRFCIIYIPARDMVAFEELESTGRWTCDEVEEEMIPSDK